MGKQVEVHGESANSTTVFFGTLRYNIVCAHGHRAWSPDPSGYADGIRECTRGSGHEFTRTGVPRMCRGVLRPLDAWEMRLVDV